MSIPTVPVGSLVFDCSLLAPFVVDLPHRALRGLLVERPGFPAAIAEILANQATVGPKAGVTQEDVDAILLANDHIADIDAFLPAARKLVELLEESRAHYDDERQRRVHAIANLIEGRARTTGIDEVLAKYDSTRAYRSATGVKATKTRKAKEKAQTQTRAVTTPPIVPTDSR